MARPRRGLPRLGEALRRENGALIWFRLAVLVYFVPSLSWQNFKRCGSVSFLRSVWQSDVVIACRSLPSRMAWYANTQLFMGATFADEKRSFPKTGSGHRSERKRACFCFAQETHAIKTANGIFHAELEPWRDELWLPLSATDRAGAGAGGVQRRQQQQQQLPLPVEYAKTGLRRQGGRELPLPLEERDGNGALLPRYPTGLSHVLRLGTAPPTEPRRQLWALGSS